MQKGHVELHDIMPKLTGGRPAPHPVRVVYPAEPLPQKVCFYYGASTAGWARQAPAPVSGRQQAMDGCGVSSSVVCFPTNEAAVPSQSGSSTPGTTASTSGRAGSTGRVQVVTRPKRHLRYPQV